MRSLLANNGINGGSVDVIAKTSTAAHHNHLTRSNSTASSTISLRLFRELCTAAAGAMTATTSSGRVGLRPISHDDYFIDGPRQGGGACDQTANGVVVRKSTAGTAASTAYSEEHDEDYVGSRDNMLLNMDEDESMSIGNNKSRHQSQNSEVSNAPSSSIDVKP